MFGFGKKKSSLVEDAKKSADWMAQALSTSGYKADFSLESLKEVDRFFDEHAPNGEANPSGLLSESLGQRMFGLGAYTGEVIRRIAGGSWQGDDKDPEGEINIALNLDTGGTCWPMQRVIKRFKNGAEDSMYVYGLLLTKRD